MGLAYQMKITVTPPDYLKRFEEGMEAYMAAAAVTFRASVFRFLEVLIRVHRVDTGRMKAAWTPMMDQYKYPYQRSWSPQGTENPAAIEEGKKEGRFFASPREPFEITIINAVTYAGFVEEKFGISERGGIPSFIPYFEKYFQEGMEYLNMKAAKTFGGPGGGDYKGQDDLGAPEGV